MKSMFCLCPVTWLIAANTLAMVANLHAADPVNVVSPASFKDKEGEGESTVFSGGPGADIRFQQFYTSANFIGSSPNGGYIKEISFRTDGNGGGGLASILPHVEIHLSYAGAFSQISTIFDQNKGAEYSLVYSGTLQIPATRSGQYDVSVVLQSPFWYNPNAGNLMVEYVNFGNGSRSGTMDRTFTAGESAFLAGSRLSSQAIGLSAGGLVMRFTVDAVPEPGAVALLVTGIVVLTGLRRRSEP